MPHQNLPDLFRMGQSGSADGLGMVLFTGVLSQAYSNSFVLSSCILKVFLLHLCLSLLQIIKY